MKKFAVLGSPISHSLSPTIHNFAYKDFGVNARYEAFEVRTEGLSEFLAERLGGDWGGFSLTMPLKEASLNFCKFVDEDSKAARAINTLKYFEGAWSGYNTDVFGFRFLLVEILQARKFDPSITEVSVLGAGGTARAALVALGDFGFKVRVFRRSKQRDEDLLRSNSEIEIVDWSDNRESLASSIVINAAPIEAMDDFVLDRELPGFLIDSLYSPWPTPLMRIAQEDQLFSGKDLLVAQAIRQIEIFLDISINPKEVFPKLRAII